MQDKRNANLSDPYKVVCLFARERGIRVLEGLLKDKRFTVVDLVVHSKLPRSESPDRSIRPEYSIFKALSEKHSIPLSTVDTRKAAQALASVKQLESFDFLITVSWRFLVPGDVFSRARIRAINVHRGKLPIYAGAEPVKRALENGEREIVLTVHEMVEEIDAGEVLVEKTHPVKLDREATLDENVETIKSEMLPLYPQAVVEALEMVMKSLEVVSG
jgi:methionyl-tRNA formyltransferase